MKIKIRAWDNEAQKMYYGTQELFDDMLGFRFEHFELDAEPVFMLSTGLKDKEGREIYAGDIIVNHPIPGSCGVVYSVNGVSTQTRIVVWLGDEARFGWRLLNGSLEQSGYSLVKCNENIFEIIGNIHENPELLEVKQ